ncbi:hypothetical protein KUTeg_024038 [Tegillarca granosa]|uniref:Coiled-coil domain-containing protein 158 n=1 Tax=Tegillarca granosa TaxID=220873 RepID=A0ABQ9E1S6_TEGGR|nr:hypothetical protein KUTeg_024038 [Tegillarca granosa]
MHQILWLNAPLYILFSEMATGLSSSLLSSGQTNPLMTGQDNIRNQSPSRASRAKTTASELLDQIRQLEIEGKKLRSSNLATLGAAESDYGLGRTESTGERSAIVPTSPGTLSSLIDISAEQKTISDLRNQLEAQRRETDKLQQQLLGDYSRSNYMHHSGIPSSPSKTGFSTLPSTDLFSSRRPAYDYAPPSHLEKALKDSQEQVSDLRKRLHEANEVSEQHKRQFRLSIEELKSKLQETINNRDAVLELRQKEGVNKDGLITKLQTSVQQMQEKLRAQEQALVEASRKAESSNQDSYMSETALNQIRIILTDAERKRGRSYFDSDPATKQGPGMLVHTLERCISELSSDLDQKASQIKELESEIGELKKNISQDKESLVREHQSKITQLNSEHEKQMQAATERANNARKQASSLQTQLNMIEKDHKKELSRVMRERDEKLKSQTALETRFEELQNNLTKLQNELDMEKRKNNQMSDKENDYRNRSSELEAKLDEKQRDVERLEKMLELVRQECNSQVNEKISYAERHEREKHFDQISSLTAQLSSVSERCNRVTLDYEMNRNELSNLKQKMSELTEKLDSSRIQNETLNAEKQHISNMLSDKKSEMDRVSQERDYYMNLLDQKNEELGQVKGQKERLTIQLEEKEKNILMMQQQTNNFTQVMETNSRKSDTLKEENDKLMQMLNERTVALEELKGSRETMSKKMKIREKRIKDLEEEREKRNEEIQLKTQEMGILKQEKDSIYRELKESRYEVANITEEKDKIKRHYEKQRSELEKEIHRLQSKLKAADQDVKLAQKTLKSRESADNQAVKVADKMQKELTGKRSEVDTLRSKTRWLEDKLESVQRDRTSLDNDKDRLKSTLNKTLTQNQQLSAELEVSQSKVLDLASQISRLEVALEKAASKSASSQAQLEQYEQDLARLKLTHQLDMQEALQKVGRNHSRKNSQNQGQTTENIPGVPNLYPMTTFYPQDQIQTPEYVQQSRHSGTSQTARDYSLNSLPTRDTDDYRQVGSELKYLLNEMRSLISSDKSEKLRPKSHAIKASHHRRSRSSTFQTNGPEYDSLYAPSSETEYHSDAEVDHSFYRSRSRTQFDDLDSFSAPGNRSRSYSPGGKHRRSYSLDDTPKFKSPDMTYGTSNFSPVSSKYSYVIAGSSIDQNTEDGVVSAVSDQNTDVVSDTEGGGGGVDTPTNPALMRDLPDTQEICKRLEEKIQSLSKMGGVLQKENKETADLMKSQGKKLKKIKESSQKKKPVTAAKTRR